MRRVRFYVVRMLPRVLTGAWGVRCCDQFGRFSYYVELFFKSSLKSDYLFTTPGFTWPDTLPFADCKGAECIGRLL